MTVITHGSVAPPARRVDTGLDVVTGAFGYSGAAVARALHDTGRRVRTMTGHPGRAPEGTAFEVRPLDFDDPLGLARGAGECGGRC